MKVCLRGLKVLDFVSNDGSKVTGTKLYISFPSTGITGEETANFFVKSEMVLPKLVVGNAYMADFNQKGKLVGLFEG